MKWNQFAFSVTLSLTPVLALFCYVSFDITSAVYSDLAHYGIKYGSEPFREIVRLTQKQILLVAVPLALAYVLAMCGWGFALFSRSRDKRP